MIDSDTIFLIAYNIGSIIIALIVFLFSKPNKKEVFNKNISIKTLMLLVTLSIVRAFFYYNLYQIIDTTKATSDDNHSYIYLIILIISSVIIGPIIEEYICRFSLIKFLAKNHNIYFCLGISSLFFALLHTHKFLTFISALILGIIFIFTNNWIYCVVTHMTFNASMFILAVVFDNYKNIFVVVISGLVFIIYTILSIVYLYKNKDENSIFVLKTNSNKQ